MLLTIANTICNVIFLYLLFSAAVEIRLWRIRYRVLKRMERQGLLYLLYARMEFEKEADRI